ncbi:MAG: DEAD/DEAH box helicase [Lentisphaeria bacterium]|jgi:superfamily II DNA or RNA helicase|nr:DEAD/DEAH box helicase [Lentisphaeria bacterium]
MDESSIARGARIVVRDAEWLVRDIDRTSSGGLYLDCVGVSELVRGKPSVFLTEIEQDISVLDPAATKLVPDASPHYRDARLYIESLLRQTPPTDPPGEERIYLGHRAAMDLVGYQLDPALQALRQPRQRILIADAVGLGKTLEAGILLSEMIRRGRAKRILVVALKSMLTQFQKELWARFSIPLVRLDSEGIRRVRQDIPSTHNPFHHFDRAIISIDTLKQDAEYRPYIENCYWDVIVIDEAHNVAERGTNSLRSRLAKLLASRSDALIMLSATPHDGSARSFASLMTMLNPTAIANPDDYGPQDIRGLFVRRFKKDIQHQVATAFKDRETLSFHCSPSPAEEAAHAEFAGIEFARIDQAGGGARLFKTTLEKALFSSPAACLETARNRIRKLAAEATPEADRDARALQRLCQSLEAIGPRDFGKYQRLLALLRDKGSSLHWTGGDPADRLVVFTERIETLKFLQKHLQADLGLKAGQIEVLHGTLPDVEQQRIVEDFGREDAPVRLLIASDIAAEGINLHYLSHRLVHFDIPWSLMVFQQRNGRVDRYGQERKPRIAYLITDSPNEKIHGDARILQILIRKDEQAYRNIGDPSAFMKAYDIDREEQITAAAMERGESADAFEARLDANVEDDPLAILLGEDDPGDGAAGIENLAAMPTLFADDFAYAREAFGFLRDTHGMQAAFSTDGFVNLAVPDSLRGRLRNLPAEVLQPLRETGEFVLTTDRDAVKREIARCRKEEQAWPRFHLLWDLHPVMQWLNETLQTVFGRHQAPVIALPPGRLAPGEAVFLTAGVIPNRKGHPLIYRWLGLQFRDGRVQETIYEDVEALISVLGLRGAIPNPRNPLDAAPLAALLPTVVTEATAWLSIHRDEFNRIMEPKLQAQLAELDRLRVRRLRQLEFDFGDRHGASPLVLSRKEAERRRVDALFHEYQEWIRDTMTTEDKPCIRVVAVFRGEG